MTHKEKALALAAKVIELSVPEIHEGFHSFTNDELAQFYAEARAEGMREAAEICGNIYSWRGPYNAGPLSSETMKTCAAAILAAKQQDKAAMESMQARIDALMLEFCPDEMTAVQRKAWADAQAPLESKA